MANIQHATLPDDKLHYPKGAAGASANTWMRANGDGTTSFVGHPSVNPTIADEIAVAATVAQELTVEGSQKLVRFDGLNKSSPNGSITTNSNGRVTFNKAGVYAISFEAQCGKTGAAADSFEKLGIVPRINGSNYENVQVVMMPGNNVAQTWTYNKELVIEANIGDNLEFYMGVQGLSSSAKAGLYPVPFGLSGWADAPSAAISVKKLGA